MRPGSSTLRQRAPAPRAGQSCRPHASGTVTGDHVVNRSISRQSRSVWRGESSMAIGATLDVMTGADADNGHAAALLADLLPARRDFGYDRDTCKSGNGSIFLRCSRRSTLIRCRDVPRRSKTSRLPRSPDSEVNSVRDFRDSAGERPLSVGISFRDQNHDRLMAGFTRISAAPELHPRLRPAHHLRHPDHRLHRPRRPVRAGRDPRQHHRTAAAGARDRHARADPDLHRPGPSRRQAALPTDRQAHRAAALARPPRRALPALAQTPGPGSQVSRRRGRLCGGAAASPATWWTSPRPPRARASVTEIAWRLGMGRSALPPGTRRWARRPRAGPGSSSAPATQVFAGAPAPPLSRRRSCRAPAPNSP
jgi:hypothetical protein